MAALKSTGINFEITFSEKQIDAKVMDRVAVVRWSIEHDQKNTKSGDMAEGPTMKL